MDPDAAEVASDAESQVESVIPVEGDREKEVETEGLISNPTHTLFKPCIVLMDSH